MLHRYLILGLLMDSPMSGYDIRKQVNAALGMVTNASYGTLYPTLHKLLAQGAVGVQEISQIGRPAKKVYQITERGRQEVLDWLKQPADDQLQREFLLKLYLARNLSANDVLALVSARRAKLEFERQALQADKSGAGSPQAGWVADYALAMCDAEVEWLRRVETHITQTSVV